MLTVSQLATRCGLSRSTLLYYESIGLLKPAARSTANYRRYGERDVQRLVQIRDYRDAGLTLKDVQALLDAKTSAGSILKRRFLEIDREIGILRRQQRAILRLQADDKGKLMTKEKWTAIMRATGFTDDEMNRWHVEFERSTPDDHQQFLEYLQIGPDEIVHIRDWSRKGVTTA